MKIIQAKDSQSNNCNAKVWLQNELVAENSKPCQTHDSDLVLYTAGKYKPLHGEIRSFSYIKN